MRFLPFLTLALLSTTNLFASVTGQIDLISGKHTFQEIEAIKVLSPVRNGQALLKVNLDPKQSEFVRARIEVQLGEVAEGWLINIGDSRTNNGAAGDAGTQSHDAELDIKNGHLSIWGSDMTPKKMRRKGSTNLAHVKNFTRSNGKLTFEIADSFVSWDNGDGLVGQLDAACLFALKGQKDKEGPENYDVFIGINRVVGGAYRRGKGVEKVTIHLFHEGEDALLPGEKQKSWFGVKSK